MSLDENNALARLGPVFPPSDIRDRREVSSIRAELTEDVTCSAVGITVESSSPVLALCRKLIGLGHDPSTPLEAYRGETLALRVKSIGHAAGLEVNGDGTGFRPARKPDRGPLVRLNQRGGEYACPRANSAQGIGGPNASR